MIDALAKELDASPQALNVPDIDTYIGLMHTLFALEDLYGLTVESENSTVSLYVNPYKGNDAARLNEMLVAWAQQVKKLRRGEISPEGMTAGGAITRNTTILSDGRRCPRRN